MYDLVVFDLDGTLADASAWFLGVRMFEDMRACVMELRRNGVKLCIATMMDTPTAMSIVRSWDVGDLFLSVRGADSPCRKGDLIRLCIEDAGATPEETLMVGDSESDMIGARACGADFVAAPHSEDFERWDNRAYRPLDGSALTRFVLGFDRPECHD